ncbi:MAG: inositol monophosphatase family protein [Planctomycetota bacterium]
MNSEILSFAETVAREAGELLLSHFASLEPEDIRHKGDIDLVTQADLDAERHIVSAIRERFPEHTISAEEEVNEAQGRSHWFIDPLDGTTNFAHGIPVFAVSLAYMHEDRLQAGVVHAPYLRETFTASEGGGAFFNGDRIRTSTRDDLRQSVLATGFYYHRRTIKDNNVEAFRRFILDVQGLRRMGTASIDLCYVACGRFDGFWEPHLSPHDVAAGVLIVQEAGGKVTDYLGGSDYLKMRRIVASNGLLHDDMLARLEYIE